MATDVTRDFDLNIPIPEGLKNARPVTSLTVEDDLVEPNAPIDIQEDTLNDDDSDLNEDGGGDDILGVPSEFGIISQTVRTAPDGSQVIDVVIQVDDIPGAEDYQFRISK